MAAYPSWGTCAVGGTPRELDGQVEAWQTRREGGREGWVGGENWAGRMSPQRNAKQSTKICFLTGRLSTSPASPTATSVPLNLASVLRLSTATNNNTRPVEVPKIHRRFAVPVQSPQAAVVLGIAFVQSLGGGAGLEGRAFHSPALEVEALPELLLFAEVPPASADCRTHGQGRRRAVREHQVVRVHWQRCEAPWDRQARSIQPSKEKLAEEKSEAPLTSTFFLQIEEFPCFGRSRIPCLSLGTADLARKGTIAQLGAPSSPPILALSTLRDSRTGAARSGNTRRQ
eukprot:scaffold48_cov311-Pinguiococcus_pyrenoidosus.AAC.101